MGGYAQMEIVFQIYSLVTLKTSSIVVMPCTHLKIPSSSMVIIPSDLACFSSTSDVSPFITSSLIVDVTGRTS